MKTNPVLDIERIEVMIILIVLCVLAWLTFQHYIRGMFLTQGNYLLSLVCILLLLFACDLKEKELLYYKSIHKWYD